MTYNSSLKILTVCAGGNVRSVTMARLLKYHHTYQQPNTLSVGVWIAPADTFDMLATWADLLLVCGEQTLWDRVPSKYYNKAYRVDVGLDRWDGAMAPELVDIMKAALETDNILRQRLGWE